MSSYTIPSAQPLTPAQATRCIREKARDAAFSLVWTDHVAQRMEERDLLSGDVKHVLKFGTVHQEGVNATQKGLFKYAIEATTPNSNGRTVRLVVIPMPDCAVKVVSAMWRDDPAQQS
jgi:hypothetical protein